MMLRETMQYQRSVSHVDVQKSIGTCIWGILCPLKDQAPYRIHSLSDDDRESNHAKSIWGLVWSMNTTIHEMTSTNYKRSKTQQKERRKRNMRRKIIKIVDGQLQKNTRDPMPPESLSLQECQRRERAWILEQEIWHNKNVPYTEREIIRVFTIISSAYILIGRCAGLWFVGRPFGLGRWNLSEFSCLSKSIGEQDNRIIWIFNSR